MTEAHKHALEYFSIIGGVMFFGIIILGILVNEGERRKWWDL